MIRLVVTDLDGTLLAPDGTIPAENVAALREAHARGVHIVIATGRPIRWLGCLAPIADLTHVVIASNGAVTYDLTEDRVVARRAFDAPSVEEVSGSIRSALPHALFGLERGDLFGTEPGCPSTHTAWPGVLQAPLAELIERVRPVVKLLTYSHTDTSDALAAGVAAAVGPSATVTTSSTEDGFGMVELSVPGVTKASTLAGVCAGLGVEASDVVAFGDMPNDADMLAWAGLGLVTADGHQSLRDGFQVIGAAGDAGVGRALRALLA